MTSSAFDAEKPLGGQGAGEHEAGGFEVLGLYARRRRMLPRVDWPSMSMKRTNQRHSVSSGLLPSLHWDGECRRWWHYVDMSSSAGQKTAITEQQARDLIARRIGGLKEDAQVRVRRIARGKLRELRETRKRWRRERGRLLRQTPPGAFGPHRAVPAGVRRRAARPPEGGHPP